MSVLIAVAIVFGSAVRDVDTVCNSPMKFTGVYPSNSSILVLRFEPIDPSGSPHSVDWGLRQLRVLHYLLRDDVQYFGGPHHPGPTRPSK
jgi:hypothetical protein